MHIVKTGKNLDGSVLNEGQVGWWDNLLAKAKANGDADSPLVKQLQATMDKIHNANPQSESQAPQKKQMSDEEKKAKIAAMSPKQKLEAAVKIFKKKLAADPSNAEAKAKLAKYEAMLAKLNK